MGLGDTLRDARMRMGMTPSEVAAATRMKVQMVEDIEQEDFSNVAAPIYGKGFIKLFAEVVGLNPTPLVQEYVDVHVHHKPRTLGNETREMLLTNETQAEPEPAEDYPEEEEPPPRVQPEAPADDLFARARAQPVPEPDPMPPEEPAALRHPEEQTEPDPPETPPPPPPPERIETAQPEILEDFGALDASPAPAKRVGMPRINFKRIDLSEAPLKAIGIVIGLLVIVVFLISAVSRFVARPQDARGTAAHSLQLAIDPPDPYLE